jgi:hypothetical protein
MIAHKENIQEYIDFLNNNDIFAKVDWFVKHLGNDNFTLNFLKHRYNNCRLNGYFMELISCFWFAEKDYIYLENTKKTQDWYSEEKIKERSKRWQ